MLEQDSLIIPGQSGLPILIDYTFDSAINSNSVVIFCHGYKGFKDWGAWHLIAEAFAKKGIAFVKFNFSHYGGTPESPTQFNNLEAFAEDNYSTQLQEVNTIINWAKTHFKTHDKIHLKQLSLIGHSRGGGIASLVASQNKLVDVLITWAAVSDFKSRFPKAEDFEAWKKTGKYHVKNGRTGQMMPHKFQFFEDFEANEAQLDIQENAKNIFQPTLIIHGDEDPAVSLENAKDLDLAIPNSTLHIIKGADHVFGMRHPWETSDLPAQTKLLVQESIDFIKRQQDN